MLLLHRPNRLRCPWLRPPLTAGWVRSCVLGRAWGVHRGRGVTGRVHGRHAADSRTGRLHHDRWVPGTVSHPTHPSSTCAPGKARCSWLMRQQGMYMPVWTAMDLCVCVLLRAAGCQPATCQLQQITQPLPACVKTVTDACVASFVHTGAPVPPGADAVVQVEDTTSAAAEAEGGQKRVYINKAAKPGQDIRPVGSDIE